MVRLNAVRLVRWVKRNGFELARGGCGLGGSKNVCAIVALQIRELGKNYSPMQWDNPVQQRMAGLNPEQCMSIERGFEGKDFHPAYDSKRYYEFGKRVAQLAGLPDSY